MLQNLDISNTLIELGNFLKGDSAIQEFCDDNFSQELKVYVGDFTRKTIPSVKDCPYIVITDFKKKEGQNIEFCSYGATLFVGVSANEETFVELENGQDDVYLLDVYDVTAKFMTLIENVFNDKTKRNRPLSRCDTDGPYPLDTRHWTGRMDLVWRIYQTLGTTYQEEL